MQCPSCGIDVPEHQKFCDECGAPLRPVTAIDRDLPTQPVETQTSEAEAETETETETGTGTAGSDTSDNPVAASAIDADLDTEPIEQLPPPTIDMWTETAPSAGAVPLVITTQQDLADAGALESANAVGSPVTDEMPAVTTPTTDQIPAIFDGSDDLVEYPAQRDPFRLRVIFIFALFGAGALLMAIVADVIDIRTTRPTSGIVTGTRTLDDLGSNLGLAGFVGAAIMVIGGLLACFGLRWGAGLAGGAGLAVLGWAGLVIGLAELPIAIAESITRTSTSTEAFTLRVTRDLGWWLVVGVGAIGLLVFLASLRSIGSGGWRALNPWLAALTAVATIVLATGPLVPVGAAVFADNFRSTDPDQDLPTAFFAGRLGQVALIALAGVVGMLIVRSFGLGLAAGGVSVSAWLWISSLVELGDNPVGIAFMNPGADSTIPHAVTTVGMVLTLLLLIVAAVLASVRLTRSRPTDASPNQHH